MITATLAAALGLALQDPAPRIAVQTDGRAVILRLDGTPPEPLFGALFAEGTQNSLFDAFANYGLLGNLGLFLGAPRPLSTMLDPVSYCEQAGLKRTTAALADLWAALPAGAGEAQRRRRDLDRLVALTLLARSEDPEARALLAQAKAGEDRFAVAWANQLLAVRAEAPKLTAHVASVLADAPANTQLVVVVDHANLPRWRDLWRVANEVGRLVSRQEVELTAMPPDEAREALAHADLVVERSNLLAYEFARRFGNALITRIVVAGPSAVTVGPITPWLHFEGQFEPDRIGAGLRAEEFKVTVRDGIMEASSSTDTRVRATATTFAIDAVGATQHVGVERAKAIAAAFEAPHLALGVALLSGDALGMQPPASVKPLIDALRAIHLRHDGSDGAHLWLDLHYGDAKPAAVAAAAAGGLLTAATGAAGDAPQALRELLREIKVHRNGATVTIEVELDEAMATWVEKLVPLLVR